MSSHPDLRFFGSRLNCDRAVTSREYSFTARLLKYCPSVARGGYCDLLNNYLPAGQVLTPSDLGKMPVRWRIAAAGFFLMHHWRLGRLSHIQSFEQMAILSQEFGFPMPEVGTSWFLPHESEESVMRSIDDAARNRTAWIELGFCWLYDPAAMLLERFDDPVVAGIGSERPDPFDIPAYSAGRSAFEGRAFARYLSRLNQIEAPGLGPGNVSDERSQRILDHFQWRDELFADPASVEIIGTDARIETEEQVRDPVRRLDWNFVLNQPVCLRRSTYASSLEAVYGLIFDALKFQGQLPSSPEEAAAHLRAMWWVHPRPLVDAAFVIDLVGSENMVDEVLRFAQLANGDGTSVYGKPVRIDIQFVIRS